MGYSLKEPGTTEHTYSKINNFVQQNKTLRTFKKVKTQAPCLHDIFVLHIIDKRLISRRYNTI